MAKQKTENTPVVEPGTDAEAHTGSETTTHAEPSPKGDAATLDFAFTRYRWVPIALLLLVVFAVGGVYFWNGYQEDQQRDAAEEAVYAYDAFLKDSFNLAIKGDGQNPGWEEIADRYSGTPTGNLANYFLGISLLNVGEYQDGIASLRKYDKSDKLYSQLAFKGIAYGYEELGDFEKAANAYLQAAEQLKNDESTPYFLFEAARTYELNKDYLKALEIYKRIQELYPNAPEAVQVEKDIARLETQTR